ncbi:alginate export family protein [Geothrix sp. PMB-07]|uniref:alginate export family protein n=1 Tax=Geothrix sp. PMB-07 TaxID=3068640 RepID=UPI002740F631|nr:alginate export family protein [Geothrix sp. PMB-07]WLT33104.1 alginate export family protein [Geothrix sp. PMB-07]
MAPKRPHAALAATTFLSFLAALPSLGQSLPSGAKAEFGFEERVRSEDWDNIADHNDAKVDYRTHYRFRSRAWLTANLAQDLEVSAGLCNENRKTTRPDNFRYNGREVIFDTLYLDYRFSQAFSVRVGRQNLMRGEGFVLFDGSSGDGSRTTYFNAIDATFAWSKSKLEFLVISDPKEDQLPVINEIKNPAEKILLNEWDEQALGLYCTGQEIPGTSLEGYYFYKTEKKDYRAVTSPAFQPDRRLHTLGGRVVQDLQSGWTLSAEAAGQRGTQDGHPGTPEPSKSIRAWGGYARAKKGFEADWKPSVSLACIAQSGQDRSSDKITAWDPLFSRWPKWSEFYVISTAPEKAIGYATNTRMWEAEVKCSPTQALDLRGTLYQMAAMEAPALTPGPIFSTGKKRGLLWQARADYRFSPSLKGHVLYEHFTPGSFYSGDDSGHFLRFELTYTFKSRF